MGGLGLPGINGASGGGGGGYAGGNADFGGSSYDTGLDQSMVAGVNTGNGSITISAVVAAPEPSSLALAILALGSFFVLRRRVPVRV